MGKAGCRYNTLSNPLCIRASQHFLRFNITNITRPARCVNIYFRRLDHELLQPIRVIVGLLIRIVSTVLFVRIPADADSVSETEFCVLPALTCKIPIPLSCPIRGEAQALKAAANVPKLVSHVHLHQLILGSSHVDATLSNHELLQPRRTAPRPRRSAREEPPPGGGRPPRGDGSAGVTSLAKVATQKVIRIDSLTSYTFSLSGLIRIL